MKKLFGLIVILTGIFIIPSGVFAVDYSIENMEINADLKENGDVHVTEEQTYQFDGKFNGITRSLIPKTNTEITDVLATENGTSLEIEEEESIYMIHRKSKDETITIELTYTIKNGVEVYADVAEFYWPFFDTNNESDYEQLDVFVNPPKVTDDVIAFGYAAAEDTATTENNGTAHFAMGKVPSETKGDIRVAYDASLFPDAAMTKDEPMRDQIMAAKTELEEKQQKFETNQSKIQSIAPIVIGIFTVYFVGLLVYAWRKRRRTTAEVDRLYPLPYFVPEEEMSLPATISYTNLGTVLPEALTAALLDLVRKEYVEQTDEESFRVKNRDTDYPHEHLLINWLFYKIGQEGIFKFDDLKAYTDQKENQTTYQKDFAAWRKAVDDEVRQSKVKETNTKLKVIIGFTSLLIIPFTFFFTLYELFGFMFGSFVLFFGLIGFALAYQSRTIKGARIFRDWTEFRSKYIHIDEKEWTELVEDEQKRAFIYGIGINDKKIKTKNEAMLEHVPSIEYGGMSPLLFLLIATNASHHFGQANEVSAGTSSGGFSAGGGTGAGGGGGGSGAF